MGAPKHLEAGPKRTTEYRSWLHMVERCTYGLGKDWKYYGGRGIRVCDKWRHSFSEFLRDVGRKPSLKHSLDRFPNNEGHYEPGNVRWATATEQAFNRRRRISNGPKHGISAYTNNRCRCDVCRGAWNAYCRERRRKKNLQKLASESI